MHSLPYCSILHANCFCLIFNEFLTTPLTLKLLASKTSLPACMNSAVALEAVTSPQASIKPTIIYLTTDVGQSNERVGRTQGNF